jgi:hypothetical protein
MSKIFLNQIQEAAQLSLFTTNNAGTPTYFNCATANRVVAINSAGNAFELKSFADWDTAFSWGNHASAGYLTSFTETDPVFTASAAAGITGTNITNWNTAFGWGNHASAGYLTSNQTITLSGQVTGSGTTSITTALATNTVGNNHIRQSAGLSVIGRSANSTGDVADITAGSDNQVLRRSGTSIGFGTIATAGIANSAVTLAKIANIATARILGRVTASSGVVEELTGTQATTLLDTFSTSTTTKGLVPGSNGVGATYFLNANGAWSIPAGGGAVPAGGTTGQVLSKIDNTDYNTQWVTVSGSGTVTSVGMSVPTGFSISGSPITTSGTLALTFTSGYSLPTDASQTNWNTAFSWGNHASVGYLTSIATNSISNSQLRQSNGYSVIGRSASTAGDVADITAANDFEILRRTAGSLGFGSIDLSQSGAVGASRLDFTNIKQGAGLSVIGVAGNAAGNIADITAGSDHLVLRRSGASIGFGTLNAAAMNNTYSASQVLTTDSSGNLSWTTPSGGGGGTVLSPSQITSDQTDYSPASWSSSVSVLRISSDSFRFINSLTATSNGHICKINNIGNFPIGFDIENTSGIAANRFAQTFVVLPGDALEVYYDGTSQRWRLTNIYSLNLRSPLVAQYYNDAWVVSNNSDMASNAIFRQYVGTGSFVEGLASVYGGRVGVVELSTTTGATNRAFYYTTQNDMLAGTDSASQTQLLEYNGVIRTPANLSDATDNYLLQFGFFDSDTATPPDGVYFFYNHATNSGNWVLRGSNNTAQADLNSSIAVTTSTWVHLRIVIYPNQTARGWVNGVDVGSFLTSANVPASTRGFGFGEGIRKTAGTSPRVVVRDKSGIEIIRKQV